MKIIQVVGARPNFIKVAPIHRAFKKYPQVESKIVHTGQHYDAKMSDIFFNQLELPTPDFYLGIGGGSHTYQKAHVMLAFEQILLDEKPDVVLVVGDVNATAACCITAVKMGIPTVHVEAGLRSGDRSMPEEINRILTDSICNMHFVTEDSGMKHLAAENIPSDQVHFVGNVMIDSLVYYREKSREESILQDLGVKPKNYILMTMHRPKNVDDIHGLTNILKIIEYATAEKEVIFPIHPRTSNNLKKHGLYEKLEEISNLHILPPQGYLQFLHLMDNAELIITDSGGIQEETSFIQVPCITFRSSTERPVTVDIGTNILIKELDPEITRIEMLKILGGQTKQGRIPPLWDGHTAERITDIIVEKYSKPTV